MKTTLERSGTTTVKFPAAQLARLSKAAALLDDGTTAADLVIAGAMEALDNSASTQTDAVEGLQQSVEAYARRRATFAEPEYGTADPLQSYDSPLGRRGGSRRREPFPIMDPNKSDKRRIHFRLPTSLHANLRRLARQRGLTLSDFVRRMLWCKMAERRASGEAKC